MKNRFISMTLATAIGIFTAPHQAMSETKSAETPYGRVTQNETQRSLRYGSRDVLAMINDAGQETVCIYNIGKREMDEMSGETSLGRFLVMRDRKREYIVFPERNNNAPAGGDIPRLIAEAHNRCVRLMAFQFSFP
jgi:hypothetical protein